MSDHKLTPEQEARFDDSLCFDQYIRDDENGNLIYKKTLRTNRDMTDEVKSLFAQEIQREVEAERERIISRFENLDLSKYYGGWKSEAEDMKKEILQALTPKTETKK